MPPRIPRACRKHGCSKTTTDRSGYCQDHINSGWESHQKGLSRHQRGYGSKWDKIRTRVLQRDKYLCQECIKSDRVVEANAHIFFGHLEDKTNVMGQFIAVFTQVFSGG